MGTEAGSGGLVGGAAGRSWSSRDDELAGGDVPGWKRRTGTGERTRRSMIAKWGLPGREFSPHARGHVAPSLCFDYLDS